MVPFAPLEDAEEPEPCHKMELYVSGGEVSVRPGRAGLRAPASRSPGPAAARERPDRNAPASGLSAPAPAPPRLRGSPRSSPCCPRSVRHPPAPRRIPAPPPLPRLPRDARPPGHLACSHLRSSRAGTGLPASSVRGGPSPRPPLRRACPRGPPPPPRSPAAAPGLGRWPQSAVRSRCGLRGGGNTCGVSGGTESVCGDGACKGVSAAGQLRVAFLSLSVSVVCSQLTYSSGDFFVNSVLWL